MNESQIMAAVQAAWKYRERVYMQDIVPGSERVQYRGYDQVSGYLIEMWQDKTTRMVETAYPIGRR